MDNGEQETKRASQDTKEKRQTRVRFDPIFDDWFDEDYDDY